jgi:hypothetical protein
MHTVYVHYIGQEVRYFRPSCFYFTVTSKKVFYFGFFLFLHSGESAINNIMAVGRRTILRNPGLLYEWLQLSARHATLDTPDSIMQNTALCCLELYVAFTVGFKTKRRVRDV